MVSQLHLAEWSVYDFRDIHSFTHESFMEDSSKNTLGEWNQFDSIQLMYIRCHV